RQITQPLNNAPLWREVRKGENPPYQTTQVRGVETNVLIQTEAQIWRAALTVVILAVSGVIMLFGRYVVLPALGYTAFSWLAIISKNLHNFVGPLFAVCAVLMFVTFV